MTIRRLAATLSLAFALTLGLFTGARADDGPNIATLNTLFSQPHLDPHLFTPNFLAKIPVSDVEAFIGSYVVRLGAPTAIAPQGYEYLVTSPKGSVKVDIAFDDQHRISSLLFHDELSAANLAALQKVLGGDDLSPDWFEPSYLKDVPTEKLTSLLADMHKAMGKLVRVDTQNSTYVAIFENGATHAQVSADIDGRIDYLAFSKPQTSVKP
jgi:hypothetical protein